MNKKDQLLKGFSDVYNKMVWLNKNKMEKELKECKPSEVHCIEYIEENKDVNVTKLAENFFMTRGAISKLTKKLIARGYIESYSKEENRKEIYFRLTDQGKRIYNTHEKLHKEFSKRDEEVFKQITDEEMDSMLMFIENYNKHLDEEIKTV